VTEIYLRFYIFAIPLSPPAPVCVCAVVRAGGAAEEWQRLSILLKLLSEISDVWGVPTALYGLLPDEEDGTAASSRAASQVSAELNADEREKEAKAMRCFFHPNSMFRTVWDLVQVLPLCVGECGWVATVDTVSDDDDDDDA
jgi:hypothetical protein